MRYGPVGARLCPQTAAELMRTQVPGDVIEPSMPSPRGATWCSFHDSLQALAVAPGCAGTVGLPGSAIDRRFDHPFPQLLPSGSKAAPNLQRHFKSDPNRQAQAMADAILDAGEQTEVRLPAPDWGTVRRPWHPSQGGAPWDTDCIDDWHTEECDCPACRRPARR
jgi:hypothetical protein